MSRPSLGHRGHAVEGEDLFTGLVGRDCAGTESCTGLSPSPRRAPSASLSLNLLSSPLSSLSPSLPGKDATEDFDEIGHSNAAKEQLAQFYLGEFEGGGLGPARKAAAGAVKAGAPVGAASPAVRLLQVLLPLLAVAAAVLLPRILSQG